MAVEKVDIEKFLGLAKQAPVLDVRSPGEFAHAHIPGAVSFPLFTDEERKIVGTAYKQQSREAAIRTGLDFFGVKMRKMVEEAEALNNKTLLVHCWRGGMRSAGVAWLLDLYGFKVYTLVGGYKKFRHYVLDTFKLPFRFNIIGGYTGSGKTELVQELERRGEPVVDLEAIAGHKGSAFGNIGLPKQPGQEMFENILAGRLREKFQADTASPVWLEDESQRIGLVNIPGDLWKTMRSSPVRFLDIPFEKRLDHVAEEYGRLDPEKLEGAIGRISQKLGNLNAKTAIFHLKEGKTRESFGILLSYYDKYYLKALHNREGIKDLLHTIPAQTTGAANAALLLSAARESLRPTN